MSTSPLPRYNPQDDVVELQLINAGTSIVAWKEYEVRSHYLTPFDSFHCRIAADHLTPLQKAGLQIGASFRLQVNGHQQMYGIIGELAYPASRDTGSELVISGRDKIGQVVDSCVDPSLNFKEGTKLEDFLVAVFAPFGYTASDFLVSNEDNRGIISGNVRGVKSSHNKRTFGQPLKSYTLHQTKPYQSESAWRFANRICQRLGLWLHSNADGSKIVASKPDYGQAPIYTIRRSYDSHNTVLYGEPKFNLEEQPSIIVADGFSGQTNFGFGRLRSYVENPVLSVDNSAVIAKYPSAKRVELKMPGVKATSFPWARPIFLHDDEAKDQRMLDNYVLREMALRMRHTLTFNPTVFGHEASKDPLDGKATRSNWTVDTMVNVVDDISGINEPMWIIGRVFHKSRGGGTTTELELIRKNSFQP